MWKFVVVGAAALALAGCNSSLNPNVATPNQVVIGINAYNTAVVTGTAYLRLPLCGTPPCRTQALSQEVYTALKSGRAARNVLLADLRANVAAPVTAIQTLQAAYAVLQQIPQQ